MAYGKPTKEQAQDAVFAAACLSGAVQPHEAESAVEATMNELYLRPG